MINKKIVATIQVRMGSSRLPGKVMKEVCGKPIVGHLVERVKRAKTLDEVVVATSINVENDIIEQYCLKNEILCFRGSEDDVMDRMLKALQSRKADVGVEIFGDGPFADPVMIDQFVSLFMDNYGKYDFVGNDLKTTYPPGTEIEVFSVSAFQDASRRTADPKIREHGTYYLRQHPEIYKLHNVEAPPELNYPEMEIELDTDEDFEVVRHIFETFYSRNPQFSIQEVVNYLRQKPAILNINKNVPRRWKEARQK